MGGWESMKRRAELIMAQELFKKEEWKTIAGTSPLLYDRVGGAGYHLFEELSKKVRKERKKIRQGETDREIETVEWKLKDGKWREIELVLIAHSMGTFVANRALSRYPHIPFKRIIYLGAATSIRSVEENVFPYLRQNPESGFWSFSLHPADEARDRFGFGSVLHWIDAYFETLGTQYESTFGRTINVRYLLKIPDDLRGQVSIVEFDQEDRPKDHESLDDWRVVEMVMKRAMASKGCHEVPAKQTNAVSELPESSNP
jgi:hypothetical protein